jgi:nicotinamidase-related amidase
MLGCGYDKKQFAALRPGPREHGPSLRRHAAHVRGRNRMANALAAARAPEHHRDFRGAADPHHIYPLRSGQGAWAGAGMWKHYYERWHMMTIERMGPELVDLVPELVRFVPPARVFNKYVYSPWTGTELHLDLKNAGIDTLIITGGETDVCVLSTVLGAIDWGFRVILVTDALCSSADETHDAMMEIYLNRFGEQVETVTTETLFGDWPAARRGGVVYNG